MSSVEKQARKRLKLNPMQQVELYRLLVNSIQDYAIFYLDAAGYVASWNKGAQRLKGYKADEIIGKHFSVFYTSKDIKAGRPAHNLEECLQYGHIEDEGWRVKRDGSRFWADVIITAIHDESGQLVGYAKVTRDLTERKRQEDMLRHANEKLQRHQIELEGLNSAKDEFISVASHQLRTPATGVKQFLGLLREGYAGELTPRQREFVDKAYESNDRQIALVNDLLRVAQLDAGRVNLTKTRIDVGGLVRDVIDEQINRFHDRGQFVSYEVPTTPILAFVDHMRYRMVLENIIDNASKYTPEGGKVVVSVTMIGSDVCVSVRDTGVGIESDELPRLFEKFSRIPNELSDVGGGSGLGLYWAHKIITLHNGAITVHSEPGEGSIFGITVPQGNLND